MLVSWPGIQYMLPAVDAWSLNHWTARELPQPLLTVLFLILYEENPKDFTKKKLLEVIDKLSEVSG